MNIPLPNVDNSLFNGWEKMGKDVDHKKFCSEIVLGSTKRLSFLNKYFFKALIEVISYATDIS